MSMMMECMCVDHHLIGENAGISSQQQVWCSHPTKKLEVWGLLTLVLRRSHFISFFICTLSRKELNSLDASLEISQADFLPCRSSSLSHNNISSIYLSIYLQWHCSPLSLTQFRSWSWSRREPGQRGPNNSNLNNDVPTTTLPSQQQQIEPSAMKQSFNSFFLSGDQS